MADNKAQDIKMISTAVESASEVKNMNLFGLNMYVIFGLLLICGIIGYFIYKYFFEKKPDNKKSPPDSKSELDQVHAYYQQQMALQENEYRHRLEQMKNGGLSGAESVEEVEENEEREVEIDDDSSSDTNNAHTDAHTEAPVAEQPTCPINNTLPYDMDLDLDSQIKIELDNVPQEDVKVVRRGKKKGAKKRAPKITLDLND